MDNDKERIEKESRRVFDKLHVAQAEDPLVFKRLTALLDTEYLKVPANFFENKICLDAGCGSNANAAFAMLEMNAAKVYAFDLDDSIFNTASRMLREFPQERWELSVGNVHNIHFETGFFDFVHCAGVLHHSTDIYKGLAELIRVLKPGGMLHISVNGTGGIMRDIGNVLRDRYATDPTFKELIDSATADDVLNIFDFIFSEMRSHNDEPELTRETARRLFNNDLLLTIRDRIQAPLYLETTEKELRDFLSENGCTSIERLKKYPIQHNIRRYLAPFYSEYDHPIARLLYGDGIPRFKAIKE
jgi:ubiquinone/menaquinone biosynthesis C-methylase UbiE